MTELRVSCLFVCEGIAVSYRQGRFEGGGDAVGLNRDGERMHDSSS
jgi:hypothetical protein